ncbi:hypothetical protein UFOVP247_46 [uncultured Caudovirales phage]|uniref:Uncharacterized protein n=1 Tax=uncultured Caudovirales phage TaxID=2100421 RepID=A0A6J7WSY2_9CAUD|nr:hypothetical protein UFOVP247_46 [uncultured Caudovirales phage]
MALWGNNDSKTASGYANISSNGFVNGTSSSFQTEAKVGDFILMANTDYMIISITSNTQAQVVGPLQNTSVTAQANAAYVLSEKPKYILLDDGYHGQGGASNTVFGMDTTETGVSNGAIREVVIVQAGSGYASNGTVTVTGGVGNSVAAAANAFVSGGRVTQIKFSNNGIGYTISPTLTVSAPAGITFNALTAVSNTNDTIALTTANSKFLVGDQLVYTVAAGNTAVTGLANNGTYYVSFANTTTIALSDRYNGANIDLTATVTETGHTLTGQTAVVASILSGVHESDHAGWVRRIVGTGGRAGRITHETLVAMGSIAGDANDDNVMPDA